MSTLQNKTLQNYKKTFPQHTLKDISMETGIQLTRVFRVLNGSEMKVSELEAFQKVINKNFTSSTNRLSSLVEECTQRLSEFKLQNMVYDLESLLKMNAYTSSQEDQEFQLSC